MFTIKMLLLIQLMRLLIHHQGMRFFFYLDSSKKKKIKLINSKDNKILKLKINYFKFEKQ